MFNEFTSIKKSLWHERVNSYLGIAFLGTIALWASLFVWNFATGSNPVEQAISAAIDHQTYQY